MAAYPRNIMSLADLSVAQIKECVALARHFKSVSKRVLPQSPPAARAAAWASLSSTASSKDKSVKKYSSVPPQSLKNMSIALMFSKRSTRTRVSSETACNLLGGQALFLGKEDIQLGVNESPRDTAEIVSRMCQGIFARVGDHSEIEELAKYSRVPVINALSSLWHPTQVLADLQTLYETRSLWVDPTASPTASPSKRQLRPLHIAYVGDSANVLHDMLVSFPRLGHTMTIGCPAKYRAPEPVLGRVAALGCDKAIRWTSDPKEAVEGADVVITDTWISMGQEAEYAERVKAFEGYQVTEALCKGANPNWKFMHCLPRKKHEVDDEVFYGPRSLVFPEGENRKWTAMALFHTVFGNGETYKSEAELEADLYNSTDVHE